MATIRTIAGLLLYAALFAGVWYVVDWLLYLAHSSPKPVREPWRPLLMGGVMGFSARAFAIAEARGWIKPVFAGWRKSRLRQKELASQREQIIAEARSTGDSSDPRSND